MSEVWSSILPLIIAVLTIVGGFFAYSFNKRIDREHSLIELRRTAYKNLLASIVDVTKTNNSEEAITAYNKYLLEIFILASDEVVAALSDFVQSFGVVRSAESSEISREKFVKLARAVRTDGYEATKLSDQQLKAFVPLRF